MRIDPREVSLGDDSGHRGLCPHRVQELVTDFVEGKYMMAILAMPTLQWFAEDYVLDSAGKHVLGDGKSHTAAVVEILGRVDLPSEDPNFLDFDKLSTRLQEALLDGVQYTKVRLLG